MTAAEVVTARIKEAATALGFDLVGITSAEPALEGEERLLKWIERGFAGDMEYMRRDPLRRAHPEEILPGARSVVSLAKNYYQPGPEEPLEASGPAGRIARYAWGADYHLVIEKMLDRLAAVIRELGGRVSRSYVDHGPVLERAFAERAGLGFIGKNTTLITERFGSWVFLAELITNLELEMDQPKINQCGACRACIEACPTGALIGPFQLDARRCISYLTIEQRGEIPAELRPLVKKWAFGCDICQEVCPLNAAPVPTAEPEFSSQAGAGAYITAADLEESFKKKFGATALSRAGRNGLLRNLKVVAENAY